MVEQISEHDTFHGLDVNDFKTTITYGVFNDPKFWEPLFERGIHHAALRPQLLEVPLYEDESASRVVRHAKLMNEDRIRSGIDKVNGLVVVKRQITLSSPWLDDVGPIPTVDPPPVTDPLPTVNVGAELPRLIDLPRLDVP